MALCPWRTRPSSAHAHLVRGGGGGSVAWASSPRTITTGAATAGARLNSGAIASAASAKTRWAHRATLARSPQPCLWLHTSPPRWTSSGRAGQPVGTVVELKYEEYAPPQHSPKVADDVDALVICHGLFGSKQNWRSLAKLMAKRWGLPIYLLDLRNHGESPHVDGMSYQEMAADVAAFFERKRLRNVCLVGHSMGGKAVLAFALSPTLPAQALSSLVSVDMTPARGPLSPEFQQYVEALLEIDSSGVESRAEADKMLSKVKPSLGIRQFLLTNLVKPPGSRHWRMRVPLAKIRDGLAQIGDFPYDPPPPDTSSGEGEGDEPSHAHARVDGLRPTRSWRGRTLFIKGKSSKYINRRNLPICQAFFPHAQHVTLDTGHWVQAERPQEFVEALEAFLRHRTSPPGPEASSSSSSSSQ